MMTYDTLAQLGLHPDQTTSLTGNRRSRFINFLLRWEEYEAASACLEGMLAGNPERVGLYDAHARALLGLGQPDAAVEVMQARHRIRVSLSSQVLEARVHLACGDRRAARAITERLVAQQPESVTAWRMLGDIHLACGDLDGALNAYRRLAELNPDSRSYLLGMVGLYEKQGDLVSASAYAVRLEGSADADRPLPATTLRRLRDYYHASGESNRAEDLQAALSHLYAQELAELKSALGSDLPLAARAPAADRVAPQPEPEAAGPAPTMLSAATSVTVSEQERREIEAVVQAHFGHESLLPGQAEIIAKALRGQDVLAILPTGGGKSLCYQIPALVDPQGMTLVISPLIALMKDQVDSLPPSIRPAATHINSTLDGMELDRRMRRLADGRYKLVYAAPERLRQTPFLHALRRAGVTRLVIDEAHCVSVWGHDFRPDYLHIAQARQHLGDPPLLALTATAPPRVRRDIVQRLSRPSHASGDGMAVVATDVHRPNLFLSAVRARSNDEKLQRLLVLCHAESGSGIIYAGTRARCEQIAALLRDEGISAGFYHAGIGDRAARSAAQDQFMQGQVRVMVATIAFGMGIDKPDIRFIIHLQLPASLEAYYQEAGRAGRDGKPAHCTLIHASSDRAVLTRRARRDALTIDFLRGIYAAAKGRLGRRDIGRVEMGDLVRDVRAEETAARVGLSMLEEAGLLRRHSDVPRTAVVRLLDRGSKESAARSADQSQQWSAFVRAARLRPGQSLPLDLTAIAQAADLDPSQIEAQLLTWADRGWLAYRPAGRGLLLELLPPPEDAGARVEALIDRQASIQVQRVDEIAAYATTRRCRHGHISAYLTGRSRDKCGACDNCQPKASPLHKAATALDLPGEREQLLTVLKCVASAPWSWGKTSLVYILRGSPRASDKGRESPQWGGLRFRSRTAVDALIDRLVNGGFLQTRQLDHGGIVIDLSAGGRSALSDPSRLASIMNAAPPTSGAEETALDENEMREADAALYGHLKTWRLETAQANKVPPYVVAHDTVLKRIATTRPQDEAQLSQIKGIGPKKLAQFGTEILALVREAESDNRE
jgi:ATP-dependent DNA helicase RecQ